MLNDYKMVRQGYLPKAATHDVMIGLLKKEKWDNLSLDRGTLMNIKKRLVRFRSNNITYRWWQTYKTISRCTWLVFI